MDFPITKLANIEDADTVVTKVEAGDGVIKVTTKTKGVPSEKNIEAGKVKSVNGMTGDVTIDTFPVGAILPFSGDTVPVGYLTCNGASVSRTLYADLFAVIGTTYGAGDGSTTFNLPNLGTNIVSDVATGNLQVKGNGMALGLTNGDANFALGNSGLSYNPTCCYKATYGASVGTYNTAAGLTPTDKAIGVTTDGSKSGMVVPMTATKTTVKYIIKAFATITNSGNVDAKNIMSAVEGIQSGLANINSKITDISDYIIESYRSGTSWYRVWKSGWLEQGGVITTTSNQYSTTFLKPFSDVPSLLIANVTTQTYFVNGGVMVHGLTKTGFTKQNLNSTDAQQFRWEARGQGA